MDYDTITAHLLLDDEHDRSLVYRGGVSAALRLRIEGEPTLCPAAPGSVEYDAWHYGCQRGANEFRNALLATNGDRVAAIARLQCAGERRVA